MTGAPHRQDTSQLASSWVGSLLCRSPSTSSPRAFLRGPPEIIQFAHEQPNMRKHRVSPKVSQKLRLGRWMRQDLVVSCLYWLLAKVWKQGAYQEALTRQHCLCQASHEETQGTQSYKGARSSSGYLTRQGTIHVHAIQNRSGGTGSRTRRSIDSGSFRETPGQTGPLSAGCRPLARCVSGSQVSRLWGQAVRSVHTVKGKKEVRQPLTQGLSRPQHPPFRLRHDNIVLTRKAFDVSPVQTAFAIAPSAKPPVPP